MFLKMLEYEVSISLNTFWSQFSYLEIIYIIKYKEEVKRSNDFRPLVFVIDFNQICMIKVEKQFEKWKVNQRKKSLRAGLDAS